jgi:hypothetical protein
VAEKVTHEAPSASGIREVEKSTFFLVKMGFSLPNWLFQQTFVIFDNLYTSPINLKRDNLKKSTFFHAEISIAIWRLQGTGARSCARSLCGTASPKKVARKGNFMLWPEDVLTFQHEKKVIPV